MREALRNPNGVLNSLSNQATQSNYQFKRLYRNLYNPNFFLLAYQSLYNNKGSMTAGVDGETLNGMGMERINALIERIKDHSYQPNPVKRQYIPKANGKRRPLGIPSTDDKLVQEVIRMMLERIYEPVFSNWSHGFRPKRSCHTALGQIQRTYTGIKWFVEGDIKGCFDNIDQHILINIIRRRIKDEQFIALLWKFLRAGYMENWTYHGTYSGAAQGSVISPILSNIYMNELDTYMRDYKLSFDKGVERSRNKEYARLKSAWYRKKQKHEEMWDTYTDEEKSRVQAELKEDEKKWTSLPSCVVDDASYRRITYCRYADDFLIGIIGSKADAEMVKQDVKDFLKKNLNLDLSVEKTLITHSTDKARFLGYDVTLTGYDNGFQSYNGARMRQHSGRVKLYLPKDKWVKSLLEKGILHITVNENGKEKWIPVARSSFVNRAPVEIIGTYNAEIRGMYNYYKLACNVSVLQKYRYVMEYSMYKTLACKYKRSMTKIKCKYTRNGIFSIPYITEEGKEKQIEFYHKSFCKQKQNEPEDVDYLPKPVTIYKRPNELILRILKGNCEWCNRQKIMPKVYQVKKLEDLNPDAEWERIMLKKRRKTLILCEDCFDKVTKADV